MRLHMLATIAFVMLMFMAISGCVAQPEGSQDLQYNITGKTAAAAAAAAAESNISDGLDEALVELDILEGLKE